MPPRTSPSIAHETPPNTLSNPAVDVLPLKGGRMANVATKKLILVPAVITLAVSLLRLLGELNHWSTRLFNPAPGGGGAIVGIAWLVLVFGIYFALKLAAAGERPSGVGPAIGYPLLGFALVPAAGFAARALGAPPASPPLFGVVVVTQIALGRAYLEIGRRDEAFALLNETLRTAPDPGKLGHALRRGSPQPCHDGTHPEMGAHRRRAPAHDLDLVHDRGRRSLRGDRPGDQRPGWAARDGVTRLRYSDLSVRPKRRPRRARLRSSGTSR